MIEKKNVEKYLDHIRQIKKSHRFYDCHVHPFDIILEQPDYYPNPFDNEIYSIDKIRFESPQLDSISLKSGATESKISHPAFVKKLILMQSKKLYKHIGPRVMKAFMDLSAIDKVILLQVPQKESDMEKEMNLLNRFFSKNDNFVLSGSLPNNVTNANIDNYIKNIVQQYAIKAFKLHPIITGIDLSTSFGRERVENILSVCSDYRLPLVIHGGTSYLFKDQPEGAYTKIENLEKINWGLNRSFVVIAHAASYDCERERVESIILPRLKKMLEKHDNLLIDISALGFDVLTMVLKKIDTERIIFGSDALYYSQWSTVIKLFHALHELSTNADEKFLKIMSVNPEKTVFSEN